MYRPVHVRWASGHIYTHFLNGVFALAAASRSAVKVDCGCGAAAGTVLIWGAAAALARSA